MSSLSEKPTPGDFPPSDRAFRSPGYSAFEGTPGVSEPDILRPAAAPGRPLYAAEAMEDLLLGGRLLWRAFLQAPFHTVLRDAPVIGADEPRPPVCLIRNGVAFHSSTLADGRRAILDLLVPGDIAGLDYLVLKPSGEETIAASRVGYHALGAAELRALMANRAVALRILALMAEARRRVDRLAATIGRLDARGRLAALLLDVHDRLRRRELISRPSFNLPLTQEQIADHLGLTLVHVNRTLRRLREDRLVSVDRQVVIITDLDGLRALARSLPQIAEAADPSALDNPTIPAEQLVHDA